MYVPTEVMVALCTGIFSSIGLIITGIFKLIAIRKKKNTDSSDEANKSKEALERKQFRETVQRQLNIMTTAAKESQKQYETLAREIDRVKQFINEHVAISKEDNALMTHIASRQSQSRSILLHMNARTEMQMKTMIDLIQFSMRAIKDCSICVSCIGDEMLVMMPEGAGKDALQKTLNNAKNAEREMFDSLLNANSVVFKSSDDVVTILDDDIEKTNQRHQKQDTL